MKKRFTEEQIIKALKRLEAGEKPKDLCRELSVHEQTLYNWKSKFGGMEVSEAKRFTRGFGKADPSRRPFSKRV